MKLNLSLSSAFAAFLAGCATTPAPTSSTSPIPANRMYAFQSPSSKASGSIVVTRDEGFLGGGCYYSFWIDGVLATRLGTSETGVFYIEPGEHVLRSGRDPQGRGMCALESDNWTQRETFIKPGENKAFRLTIDMNGKTDIIRGE